jgi:hypothetical protein
MPEFNYYINDFEKKELFNFIENLECKVIQDKKYYKDTYDIVTTANELLELTQKDVLRFFILTKYYSIYDLYLEQNEFFTNEEIYFIKQKYGGPYLDIIFYQGFSDDAPVKYKRTSVFYHPRYIKLQEDYEEFKVSEDFITWVEKINKFLKSKCKNVKICNKKYWISKEVIKELRLDL